MADNTVLNAGTGGDTIASDDIAGVKYQRVKMTWGPDGTANDADDASGKRVPVKVPANDGVDIGDVTVNNGSGASAVNIQDGGNSITVDGTITASNAAGDVANDGVDSGNPVKIGGKAQLTTGPAAVSTAADRVDAQFDGQGRQVVRSAHQGLQADNFSVLHAPTTNTQATITQAAAGAGKRLVCTSITAVLAATATAPTAVQTSVTLVTDVGGTPVTLWAAVMSLPAVGGAASGVAIPNLWIMGGSNKDLRLRFEAAGGANTIESVAMTGVIVAE